MAIATNEAGPDSVSGLVEVKMLRTLLLAQPDLGPAVFEGSRFVALLGVLQWLHEGVAHLLLADDLLLLPRRHRQREIGEKSKLVDERTGGRHSLEDDGDDGEKLGAMFWITPGNAGNRASTVDNEMLRPVFGLLQNAAKCPLILPNRSQP